MLGIKGLKMHIYLINLIKLNKMPFNIKSFTYYASIMTLSIFLIFFSIVK